MSRTHHLAQVNIARMRAPLDDPSMAGFVDNLDRINGLGASSPGFVWIMQDGEEHGGNTDVAFFGDPTLISNITVWEDVDSLMEFTLRTEHLEFLRRRREWFVRMEEPSVAAWWVPAGHVPDVAEAEERLQHLRVHGPTARAFTLADPWPAPATVTFVGRVASSLTDASIAPKQADEGAPDAWVVLDPEFLESAADLEPGDPIVVLTWLHLADRDVQTVHPRGDRDRDPVGVFSTRSPARPNPIGLHPTRILEVDGRRIRVAALEAVDGTPVIDVKRDMRADLLGPVRRSA